MPARHEEEKRGSDLLMCDHVSFVQYPVVFALPCHDTDAQNTA